MLAILLPKSELGLRCRGNWEIRPNRMEFLPDSPLALYFGVFFLPFVQEDVAIMTAASLGANNPSYFPTIFLVILSGLFVSDVWKYWIGWAALRHPKARAFAEKKQVAELQEKVQEYPLVTIFTVRFVPLARIPAYVACGFFKVPYWKFCLFIAFSATIYTSIIFAICYWVGEIIADQFKFLLPVGGISIALLFVSYHLLKRKYSNKRKNV